MKRRDFLKQASIGAAALSATQVAAAAHGSETKTASLPTIQIGAHTFTRLIAGYNQVGGHSHATPLLSQIMRNYFTVEKTVEFLQHCETQGINAFQFDLTKKVRKVLDIMNERGSKLKFICIHAERPSDASLDTLLKYKPVAIVHHGGVTDGLFRVGRAEQVHDFVKKVRDTGALAGVSTHNPANLARMADQGWECDLFMTCFHNISRTREEMEEEFGAVTVGEPFIEADPEKMTRVVRQIDTPCLGFKILAAGRKCHNKHTVARAFRYAFENVKPKDALIVGMIPLLKDEVKENAAHTMKYGQA